MTLIYYVYYLGTKTKQKKFIQELRKTPNSIKPKKLNSLGVIQSTITTQKELSPAASTNSSNLTSSLVSADYESSSSD